MQIICVCIPRWQEHSADEFPLLRDWAGSPCPHVRRARRGVHRVPGRSRWSNPQTEQRWRRSLERHAYPALRHRLVSEIHTRDVVRVLVKLRERFPKLVPRVRQQISAVLSWAVGMGHRSDDPCGSALDALMPGKPSPSDYHLALPYAQVPATLATEARASPAMSAACGVAVTTRSAFASAEGLASQSLDLRVPAVSGPGPSRGSALVRSGPLS